MQMFVKTKKKFSLIRNISNNDVNNNSDMNSTNVTHLILFFSNMLNSPVSDIENDKYTAKKTNRVF